MADVCPSACLSHICGGAVLTCTGLGRRSMSRSLAGTLVAAASTMFFLASANSQFAPIVSSTADSYNCARLLMTIKLALCEPYFAFAYSLVSACITWSARRKLIDSKEKKYGHRLVGLMFNCPILIEIPVEFQAQLAKEKAADQVPNQDSNVLAMHHCKGAGMLAMTEIATEQESMDAVVAKKVTKDMEAISRLETSFSHQVCEVDVQQQSNPSCSRVDSGKDMEKVLKEFKIVKGEHLTACELSPSGGDHPNMSYIELHPSPFDAKQVHERMILLKLGLVPEYEQLQFLRSRNTFQAVVTTLQGLHYMLGVVQRLVGHLSVSPLEAILASFNFITILQYILNVYTCVHYQRPLVLCLDSRQFYEYLIYCRPPSYSFFGLEGTSSQPISRKLKLFRLFGLIAAFLALLSLFAFQFAFVHYALTYMHRCLLCSISAIIICLLSLSAVILVSLLISKRFRELYEKVNVHTIIRLYTSLVSISSIALAIATTVKHWHIFKTPHISWLTSILPQGATTNF